MVSRFGSQTKDGRISQKNMVDWPAYATDRELTDDDVIIRYEGEEVIGLTILHASQR